jgi:hypothetical protein
MGAKRTVAGRSLPYDQLLAGHQSKFSAWALDFRLTFQKGWSEIPVRTALAKQISMSKPSQNYL